MASSVNFATIEDPRQQQKQTNPMFRFICNKDPNKIDKINEHFDDEIKKIRDKVNEVEGKFSDGNQNPEVKMTTKQVNANKKMIDSMIKSVDSEVYFLLQKTKLLINQLKPNKNGRASPSVLHSHRRNNCPGRDELKKIKNALNTIRGRLYSLFLLVDGSKKSHQKMIPALQRVKKTKYGGRKKKTRKKNKLSLSDYRKILKFYKMKIPKSASKIRKEGNKIIAKKFCSCIKKVRKKFKKEGIAIGICTKSVITRKGIKRGKFKCKKRRTIKLYKGGSKRSKKNTRKKRGGDGEKGSLCAICYESTETNYQFCKNHYFCLKCLQKYLKAGGEKCPLCRGAFWKPERYAQILHPEDANSHRRLREKEENLRANGEWVQFDGYADTGMSTGVPPLRQFKYGACCTGCKHNIPCIGRLCDMQKWCYKCKYDAQGIATPSDWDYAQCTKNRWSRGGGGKRRKNTRKKRGGDGEKGSLCAICYESTETNYQFCKNHYFCLKCLQKYIKTGSEKCPLCRGAFWKPERLEQILHEDLVISRRKLREKEENLRANGKWIQFDGYDFAYGQRFGVPRRQFKYGACCTDCKHNIPCIGRLCDMKKWCYKCKYDAQGFATPSDWDYAECTKNRSSRGGGGDTLFENAKRIAIEMAQIKPILDGVISTSNKTASQKNNLRLKVTSKKIIEEIKKVTLKDFNKSLVKMKEKYYKEPKIQKKQRGGQGEEKCPICAEEHGNSIVEGNWPYVCDWSGHGAQFCNACLPDLLSDRVPICPLCRAPKKSDVIIQTIINNLEEQRSIEAQIADEQELIDSRRSNEQVIMGLGLFYTVIYSLSYSVLGENPNILWSLIPLMHMYHIYNRVPHEEEEDDEIVIGAARMRRVREIESAIRYATRNQAPWTEEDTRSYALEMEGITEAQNMPRRLQRTIATYNTIGRLREALTHLYGNYRRWRPRNHARGGKKKTRKKRGGHPRPLISHPHDDEEYGGGKKSKKIKDIINIFKQYPDIFPRGYFRYLPATLEKHDKKGTLIYKNGVVLTYTKYKKTVNKYKKYKIKPGDVKLNQLVNKNQGNGKAKKIFLKFMETHKDSNLLLDVLASNKKAIKFYRKNGFKKIDDTKFGDKLKGIVMLKRSKKNKTRKKKN